MARFVLLFTLAVTLVVTFGLSTRRNGSPSPCAFESPEENRAAASDTDGSNRARAIALARLEPERREPAEAESAAFAQGAASAIDVTADPLRGSESPLALTIHLVDESGHPIEFDGRLEYEYWSPLRPHHRQRRRSELVSLDVEGPSPIVLPNIAEMDRIRMAYDSVRGITELETSIAVRTGNPNEITHVRSEPIDFEPGDDEVEIRLTREGVLRGSLVLPDDVPTSKLRASANRREVAIRSDGSLGCKGLRAGQHRLVVTTDPGRKRIGHIVPFEIKPGATTTLAPIDLRKEVVRVSMRVDDARGEPLERGLAFAGEFGHAIENGVLDTVLPVMHEQVEIDAPGHRIVKVGVEVDNVRLLAGIPVTVRLPNPLRSATGESWVQAALSSEYDHHPAKSMKPFSSEIDWIDPWEYTDSVRASGLQTIELMASSPGLHQITFRRMVDDGDSVRAEYELGFDQFEVLEGGVEFVVDNVHPEVDLFHED